MKKCKRLMTFVAVLLAFALTFSSVSIPASAATARSITVKNLPGNTLTIKAGKAFVIKTNVAAGKLRFSSSNRKIAKVTSTGKIKGLKNGKANITISLKTNSRVKKVIKVTVGKPVTGVKLNKKSLNLLKGKSASLKATIAPKNASNKKVTWKSSNSRIAKVSATGKVTAVKAGSAVITATALDGSGKKASCRVKVLTPATSLKFDKGEYVLTPGKSVRVGTTFAPANVSSKKLSWSVSDTKVATVDKNGNIKGVGAGTATVTAKTLDGSGKYAACKVTVKVPVSGIKLNTYKGTLFVGATTTLKATVQPSNATDKRYTWSSSNEKVAIVSSSGKVVAVAEGTAVITASAADGSGKKAAYTVTVSRPVTIASTYVSNPQTVRITLSAAQKLAASNFSVKASTVLNGAYNINMPLESVTTKDNKTYTLTFNKENRLTNDVRICISVSGLYGTGTAKAETYYDEGKIIKTNYIQYSCLQNEAVDEALNIYSDNYVDIKVSGLPAGIRYSISEEKQNVYFSGAPTKTGTTVSQVTAADGLGYVINDVITWNVYSDYVIAANYRPAYYVMKSGDNETYVSNSITVAGGSGSYKYSIEGNNYGLEVSPSGVVEGNVKKAGTYKVKVRVTDAANAKRYTTVNCDIYVKMGITVTGFVTDKNGNLISSGYVRFVNKNQTTPYDISSVGGFTDSTGTYSVVITPGTYDVIISVYNDFTYVYSKTYTKSMSGADFVSDVRRVEVKSNSSKFNTDGIGKWMDEDGNSWGRDGWLYLTPGTYKLTAYGEDKYGTISATVTDTTTYVTANIENRAVDIGDGKYVKAVVGKYYKFVPKTTGKYYFYSVTDRGDPKGYLYDSDMKLLKDDDDGKHNMSKNSYDFCIDYSCTEGETYYIEVRRRGCKLYVSTENPKN